MIPSEWFDPSVPHPARVYKYALGGKEGAECTGNPGQKYWGAARGSSYSRTREGLHHSYGPPFSCWVSGPASRLVPDPGGRHPRLSWRLTGALTE